MLAATTSSILSSLQSLMGMSSTEDSGISSFSNMASCPSCPETTGLSCLEAILIDSNSDFFSCDKNAQFEGQQGYFSEETAIASYTFPTLDILSYKSNSSTAPYELSAEWRSSSST